MTLGQETRWGYSTTLPSPQGPNNFCTWHCWITSVTSITVHKIFENIIYFQYIVVLWIIVLNFTFPRSIMTWNVISVNNRNSNQYLSYFHFESCLVSINILQDCLSVLLFCPKLHQNHTFIKTGAPQKNIAIGKTWWFLKEFCTKIQAIFSK